MKKELSKGQRKDIELFINWIKTFWENDSASREEFIENETNDYFKQYLNRIKNFDEKEQEEEINYLRNGE